jgi:E3 ubiquitin-protein ligase RNF213
LSFLCAWLQVELIALDVHGGTTEADILEVFERAGDVLTKNSKTSSVYVFLDEINTCAHMGLITEAICRRSVNGRRIHEGIQVLAALNPYRVRPPRPDEAESAAVGLQHSGPVSHEPSSFEEVAANNMKNLVYKVHPIPPTLKDFIFDFGALDLDTEGE